MSTPIAPIPHLRAVPGPGPTRAPRRAGALTRPRLLRRLGAQPDAAIALLSAPAGYGKTTLLRQWDAADPRPFAWLALRPEHDHPDHLLGAITARLEETSPALDGTTAIALGRLSLPRAPVVLVLDDAHVLRAPDTLEALAAVVGALRPGSLVAIATRREPLMPLARLRATGGLIEVHATDLAMTATEAAALLAGTVPGLPDRALDDLVDRTGGWPAILSLAGAALRDADDVAETAAAFTGDDRVVADFLREELLAQLDPATVEFLTGTALLGELDGELCDSVLGREGSGALLRTLSRTDVPVLPLDRHDERFVLQPLLAQMLAAELHRTAPDHERALHRRASRFHERRRATTRAVAHALAAGDDGRAAGLAWHAVCAGETALGGAELDAWLARLGEPALTTDARLAVAAGLHAVARGARDDADRRTAVARTLAGDEDEPALRAALHVLEAWAVDNGIAAMGEDADRARALASAADPWHADALLLAGVARHLSGDRDSAAELLDQGARHAPAGSAVRALCRAQRALLALERGDGEQGYAHALLALDDIARAPAPRADGAAALAHATTAFACAVTGRVDQARLAARDAGRHLRDDGGGAPWIGTETHIALARAELRLSDAAAARAHLAEASRALRRAPDTDVLHAWIDSAWERADSFAAGSVAGPAALTTAELRVLRFLPSHLSFREIAERLHVSANTVKTQAHAVYRKLDASSRSEAVARARDVGLVDG